MIIENSFFTERYEPSKKVKVIEKLRDGHGFDFRVRIASGPLHTTTVNNLVESSSSPKNF